MPEPLEPDDVSAPAPYCAATTTRGNKCRLHTVEGSEYCGVHTNQNRARPKRDVPAEKLEDFDLSSAPGRLDALQTIAREARARLIDAQTAQALVACVRQASKQTGTARRAPPVVKFSTVTTPAEAKRITAAREEMDGTQ